MISVLAMAVVSVYFLSLMVGSSFYGIDEVVDVIRGEDAGAASFAVGEIRLPRATLALLSGIALGIAGAAFQTLLKNPLASPDVIGIDAGAGFAAVAAIVLFSASGSVVSVAAVAAALVTAVALFGLAGMRSFVDTRVILMGIGLAALLDSGTAYVLTRANEWDMQEAMRWITGSLNGATWGEVLPVALGVAICVPLIAACARGLSLLAMGDAMATVLGARVRIVRALVVAAAAVMLAISTAATGPIAFVSFMAGPISARLVGRGQPTLAGAGAVGALLVLTADLIGQLAFQHRYPVGVITGVLGAPYLMALLVRAHQKGQE